MNKPGAVRVISGLSAAVAFRWTVTRAGGVVGVANSARWRALVAEVALVVGFVLGGLLAAGAARAQDAAERAASAAEASLVVNEQSRDWLVVGLLGLAVVGGFSLAYRVV